MAYNRCVGTRYCSNNCPYKVRRFNFLNWHKDEPKSTKMVYNPDVTVRMRGVMEKCTYCVQRIQERQDRRPRPTKPTLVEGRRMIPACQQACPADASSSATSTIPNSRVAKMKKHERNYAMLAELNTKPRTTYLASCAIRIRNCVRRRRGGSPWLIWPSE